MTSRTVRVARINPCSVDLRGLEDVLSPLLYTALLVEGRRRHKANIEEYLTTQISSQIELIDIEYENDEEFLGKLVGLVHQGDKTDHICFDTEPSYSHTRGFTEIFYQNGHDSSVPINSVACYHSLNHTIVRGSCVIVAQRFLVESGPPTEITNIMIKDIVRIIRRRFYRSAILVDGREIAKYYYQDHRHLLETIFGDKELQSLPMTFLEGHLTVHRPKDNQGFTNKFATRILAARAPLRGPALFLSYVEKPSYGVQSEQPVRDGVDGQQAIGEDHFNYENLTIRTLKRINLLSYGNLDRRKLQKSEVILPSEGCRPDAWLPHFHIERRMHIYNRSGPSCDKCGKPLGSERYTCPVTCRYRYCSVPCYGTSAEKEE